MGSFSEAIFFSHEKPMECDESIQFIGIDRLDSLEAYSKFLMKDLHQYIQTPFVLIVQWDGYVLDPSVWSCNFLKFDYIGAKWHWHQDGKNIGNGGFSLRSKKLLDAVASPRIEFIQDLPEDDQICRVYREVLEKEFGIKFANEDVADQFSYERSLPDAPTFGFHGIFNIWRYLDDSEVDVFADAFPDAMYSTQGFYEFFMQYFLLRKFKPLNALYLRLANKCSQEVIFSNILKLTNDEKFTRLFLELCNQNFSRK